MTGAEALLYFTVSVTAASRQVGIVDTPKVEAIRSDQRSIMAAATAVAYIHPRMPWHTGPYEIRILWWALWKYDQRTLRCVARHEVAHVALGHTISIGIEEMRRKEREADAFIQSKWNEPAQCGLS